MADTQYYMETEMVRTDPVDPRMVGVILALVGGSLVALGAITLLLGLPTLGGHVYGSRGQDVRLMFITGVMFLIAAIPNLRGGRKGVTETLRAPGPIEDDDGP